VQWAYQSTSSKTSWRIWDEPSLERLSGLRQQSPHPNAYLTDKVTFMFDRVPANLAERTRLNIDDMALSFIFFGKERCKRCGKRGHGARHCSLPADDQEPTITPPNNGKTPQQQQRHPPHAGTTHKPMQRSKSPHRSLPSRQQLLGPAYMREVRLTSHPPHQCPPLPQHRHSPHPLRSLASGDTRKV